jgi:hypothetical protein
MKSITRRPPKESGISNSNFIPCALSGIQITLTYVVLNSGKGLQVALNLLPLKLTIALEDKNDPKMSLKTNWSNY